MTRDEALTYCLAKPGAWVDRPWDDGSVVKVGPKIFAFLGSPGGDTIGLKCAATRDEANEWLERFPDDAAVMPYIGRSGWNSLTLDAAIPEPDLLEAIDFSYAWVISRLPRRERPPQRDPG